MRWKPVDALPNTNIKSPIKSKSKIDITNKTNDKKTIKTENNKTKNKKEIKVIENKKTTKSKHLGIPKNNKRKNSVVIEGITPPSSVPNSDDNFAGNQGTRMSIESQEMKDEELHNSIEISLFALFEL